MAHGYQTLQHFNHWLEKQFLGKELLGTEKKTLSHLLKNHFGKHALLIGVPEQTCLLDSTPIPFHTLLSPIALHHHSIPSIESNFQELPVLTGSMDAVILPHTLELVDNPRQLLAEACRIIKPEGLIVITGFNPVSMWGIRKLFARRHSSPWTANFIQQHKIKNWLRLADFQMEKQQTTLFQPPFARQLLYRKFSLLERVGRLCYPWFGGVYVLLARAKVTPIAAINSMRLFVV